MIMKNLKKYFSFEVQVLKLFVCCLSKFGCSVLSDVFTTWRCLTTKMFGEDFGLPIIRSTSIESDSQWSTWGSYLSVNDACEAIYLYHADALRRGLESDSVQSFWLHQTSLWYKLYRDTPCSDSRKLSNTSYLLFWSLIHWRWASTRVQAFPPYSERWWARKLLSLLRGLFILSYLNMSSYYLLETLWTKFWYNQASKYHR